MQLVGIERGDDATFRDPPFYDRVALERCCNRSHRARELQLERRRAVAARPSADRSSARAHDGRSRTRLRLAPRRRRCGGRAADRRGAQLRNPDGEMTMANRNAVKRTTERLASALLGAALALFAACSRPPPNPRRRAAAVQSRRPRAAGPEEIVVTGSRVERTRRARSERFSSRTRGFAGSCSPWPRQEPSPPVGRSRACAPAARRCCRRCNRARSCGSSRRRRPRRPPRTRRRARARCSRSSRPRATHTADRGAAAAAPHRRARGRHGLHLRRRRHAAVREPVRREDRGRLPLPAAREGRRQRVRDDDRRAQDPRHLARERGGAADLRGRARAGLSRDACSCRTGRTSSSRRSRTSSRASASTSTSATSTRSRTRTVGTRSCSRWSSGPRYNPAGLDAIPSPPCRARTFATPAAGTAVRYLRPSERSAHDIAHQRRRRCRRRHRGARRQATRSRRAATARRSRTSSSRAASTMPNRDFVLKFRVAGEHDQVEPPDVHGRADAAGLLHAARLPAGGARRRCARQPRRDGVRRRHVGLDVRPTARAGARTPSTPRSIASSATTRSRS